MLSAKAIEERRDILEAQGKLVRLLESVRGNVTELSRRVNRSTKQIYRWCADHNVNPLDYRK